LAMLLLGGIPAYLMYIKRSVDPRRLISKSSVLRGLSRFFWNRWYINPFYYKVFVYSVMDFGQKAYATFETRVIDQVFNILFPRAVVGFYNRFKKLQTGILSYNMIAVVLAFLLIILMLINFVGV